MSTTMTYNSKACQSVKADIVNIDCNITRQDKDLTTVINQANECRNKIKTFITEECESFNNTPDSYSQTSINISRRTTREYYYKSGDVEISETDYKHLPQAEKSKYEQFYKDKFLYYEASLHINAVLDAANPNVAKNICYLLHEAMFNKYTCKYSLTLSTDLYNSTLQDLYAVCMNQGMANITNIVNKLNFTANCNIKLLEVRDPAATSANTAFEMDRMCKNARIGSVPEEETIIILEDLVQDIVENTYIPVTKALDLRVEF